MAGAGPGITPLMVVPVKEWQASAAAAVLGAQRWRQAAIAELMGTFRRDPNAAGAPVHALCDADAKSVHG
eukprot:7801937-Pyramimonas_sp.AAC.1